MRSLGSAPMAANISAYLAACSALFPSVIYFDYTRNMKCAERNLSSQRCLGAAAKEDLNTESAEISQTPQRKSPGLVAEGLRKAVRTVVREFSAMEARTAEGTKFKIDR
jgi:hypothetical protein